MPFPGPATKRLRPTAEDIKATSLPPWISGHSTLYCRRNQSLYVSLSSKQFQANLCGSNTLASSRDITAVDICAFTYPSATRTITKITPFTVVLNRVCSKRLDL